MMERTFDGDESVEIRGQNYRQKNRYETSVSARLSEAIRRDNHTSAEFGALHKSTDELDNIYPKERRSKQVKWYLALGIINVCISIYISVLLIMLYDSTR